MSALENVALWHERDISHSSVERVIGPDSTILLDFGLNRLIGLLDKLIVYPENMKRNMDKSGGLIFSEAILLALVNKGLTREEGYALVQQNAMKSWEKGSDFYQSISMDAEIGKHLKQAEIDDAFDLDHHLRHVDTIFKRVFTED
jgi:adenylosuccinate lyase